MSFSGDQQRPSSGLKGVIVVGVVAIIGGGIFLYWFLNERKINGATAPHKDLIEKVLAGPVHPITLQPPLHAKKILVVDTEKRRLDWLYFDLPESMQAAKPEEVDLVAVLTYGKQKVGEYTNHKPAYRQTATVRLIDVKKDAEAPPREFEGGDPPQKIKSSHSDGTGDRPKKEVVDYLVEVCK